MPRHPDIAVTAPPVMGLNGTPSIAVAVDNARARGEITCELPESLMRMPGDLGWAAIVRDMRPLAEEDIVAVVDELFLPLVRYYEERRGTKAERLVRFCRVFQPKNEPNVPRCAS